MYFQFGCARPSVLNNEVKPTSNGAFLIDTDKRIRYSNRNSPLIGEYSTLLYSTYCVEIAVAGFVCATAKPSTTHYFDVITTFCLKKEYNNYHCWVVVNSCDILY